MPQAWAAPRAGRRAYPESTMRWTPQRTSRRPEGGPALSLGSPGQHGEAPAGRWPCESAEGRSGTACHVCSAQNINEESGVERPTASSRLSPGPLGRRGRDGTLVPSSTGLVGIKNMEGPKCEMTVPGSPAGPAAPVTCLVLAGLWAPVILMGDRTPAVCGVEGQGWCGVSTALKQFDHCQQVGGACATASLVPESLDPSRHKGDLAPADHRPPPRFHLLLIHSSFIDSPLSRLAPSFSKRHEPRALDPRGKGAKDTTPS